MELIDKPKNHTVPLKPQDTTIPLINSLTGLRFVAAALVFISHLPGSFGTPKAFLGVIGVETFFILSGFVLTYNYFDAFKSSFKGNIWRFYVSRFARIYPMHLFMFLWWFSAGNITQQLSKDWDLIIRQLTLTQSWSLDERVIFSYTAQAWTLSLEAFFYLMFPFIAYFITKCTTKKHLLVAGGIIITGLGLVAVLFTLGGNFTEQAEMVHMLPIWRIGDFILGCILGRVFMLSRSDKVSKDLSKGLINTGIIISIIAITLITVGEIHQLDYFRLDLAMAPFCMFIIYWLARCQTIFTRILSSKVMVLLGEASYSFYLLHVYFIGINAKRLNVPNEPGTYLHGLMVFLIVIFTSLGTYRYLESPSRRLIKKALLKKNIPDSL